MGTQVLYAFLFGILLFGDALSPLSICGSLLIAGGIITSSSSKPKPASSSSSSGGDKEVSAHCTLYTSAVSLQLWPRRGVQSSAKSVSQMDHIWCRWCVHSLIQASLGCHQGLHCSTDCVTEPHAAAKHLSPTRHSVQSAALPDAAEAYSLVVGI